MPVPDLDRLAVAVGRQQPRRGVPPVFIAGIAVLAILAITWLVIVRVGSPRRNAGADGAGDVPVGPGGSTTLAGYEGASKPASPEQAHAEPRGSTPPGAFDHAAAAEDLVDAMEPPEPFVREHPPTGAPD